MYSTTRVTMVRANATPSVRNELVPSQAAPLGGESKLSAHRCTALPAHAEEHGSAASAPAAITARMNPVTHPNGASNANHNRNRRVPSHHEDTHTTTSSAGRIQSVGCTGTGSISSA